MSPALVQTLKHRVREACQGDHGETHAMRKTSDFASLKYVPIPVMVPDVPMEAAMTLISGSCL